jgi:hypothetical protein
LREQQADEEEAGPNNEPKRTMIDYKQGLAVAEKIKALRYLGMCKTIDTKKAKTNMGASGGGNSGLKDFNADTNLHRMLSHEEQRRQRSLHRSRPCGPSSQERQG